MMDDLLDDFLAETNENLDALTNDLVAWEKQPSERPLLDGIFRFFHTIKGNSGFLEFERLGRLSHAAETALARARDGGVEPDSRFVSTVFEAIDAIRAILIVLAETRKEPAGEDTALIGRLEAAAEGRAETPAVAEAAIEAATEVATGGADDAGSEGSLLAKKAQASVRVPVGLLDRLMGLASELVLARNALVRSTRHGEEIPNNLIEHVSACITDLQDGINRTRMQPIEALWTPLPRLVRDLAQELSKDLELVLEGGDTEIDRQLLEAIRDPIGHMIRNAADHGVETPEVRQRLGKPAKGVIRLSARQSGGHIVMEMSDDGRGIDPDKLRSRAVAMGLMTAAQADALSETAAQSLIFEPGLSTAPTITAISGRGVGMDVVRANLERIGGAVEVRSRVGHGASFIIRVPLTLTIVPALITGLDGRCYAIAQSSIREIVRLKGPEALTTLGGRRMITLRDMLIPAIDLGEMFGLPPREAREYWGVIVEVNGIGRIALLVDSVSDQEEIVIKPLAPPIAATGVYSGATVLGNGEAALVLDLSGITARANITAGASAEDAKDYIPARPAGEMSWMLFEAGSDVLKAIPLGLVSRIENFDRGAAAFAGGQWTYRHEGQLLPLTGFGAFRPEEHTRGIVLVLDDGRRRVGVLADRVTDIIGDAIVIEQQAFAPGVAGLAMLGERSIEVVDTGWLMKYAGASGRARGAILIIGERQFAHGMLKPLLESAGHAVTVVADDGEAALLTRQGLRFDLVLTDGAAAPPPDLEANILHFSGGGVDPYDRAGLLEAVDGSIRRAAGAGA